MLLSSRRPAFVDKIFERCVDVAFSGATLRVVGREDFVAMKCFAGGPQDMADARVA
jgi:hypothetical protein